MVLTRALSEEKFNKFDMENRNKEILPRGTLVVGVNLVCVCFFKIEFRFMYKR